MKNIERVMSDSNLGEGGMTAQSVLGTNEMMICYNEITLYNLNLMKEDRRWKKEE